MLNVLPIRDLVNIKFHFRKKKKKKTSKILKKVKLGNLRPCHKSIFPKRKKKQQKTIMSNTIQLKPIKSMMYMSKSFILSVCLLI